MGRTDSPVVPRRLLASTALNDYVGFPYVAQVCRIEREVTELKSGKQRQETVFAITSLTSAQADPGGSRSLR